MARGGGRRRAAGRLALAAALLLGLRQAWEVAFTSAASGAVATRRLGATALSARGGEQDANPFGWLFPSRDEEVRPGAEPLERGASTAPSREWYDARSVLCFGDSLTAGWHDDGAQFAPYSRFFTRQLEGAAAESSRVPLVMNAGVPGESTSEMLERMPTVLRDAANTAAAARGDGADVVLILGGTNDAVFSDLPAHKIVENIVALHELAQAAGAKTGVLTVPEVRFNKGTIESVNKALREYARENPERTFLVDVAAAIPQPMDGEFNAYQDMWEEDALHLSAKGYETLGDLVAGASPPALGHSQAPQAVAAERVLSAAH